MKKLAENNPQGTANIDDDRVLAVVNCELNCHYGFEGHCGKTQYEYYHHCELLLEKNKKQRSSKTPLSVLFNNR
jgi:hypothetical protein